MGWAGAEDIFDAVAEVVLEGGSKTEILETLIATLEDRDWDTQGDCQYFDHPLVKKIMKRRHPHWFQD